ncbi:hypothetical protein R1T43_07095 [Alteromonas sp. CI.11.F.A3]|uniref:hypothetical protein n=1 Tax=Alteromonas sp. CI.11.F.A3 TaxID=3079555 RepID=UPI0029434DCD|nr:hypothetical protein [Alteromonas sp. CI.11.F.A3]WOI38790.1 hypothetical protein R1T43_07095 [Alteromonas sp. CI.11.F.A3]
MKTKKNGVLVVSVGVVAIAALGYLVFSENSENPRSHTVNENLEEQAIGQEKDSNIVNVPVVYPDYRPKVAKQNASDSTETNNANVDAMLQESEEKLVAAITAFNDALDDPTAQKEIIQKSKEAREAKKRAILQKLKNGDL